MEPIKYNIDTVKAGIDTRLTITASGLRYELLITKYDNIKYNNLSLMLSGCVCDYGIYWDITTADLQNPAEVRGASIDFIKSYGCKYNNTFIIDVLTRAVANL